jgi:hypothetical protein
MASRTTPLIACGYRVRLRPEFYNRSFKKLFLLKLKNILTCSLLLAGIVSIVIFIELPALALLMVTVLPAQVIQRMISLYLALIFSLVVIADIVNSSRNIINTCESY